MTPSPGPLVAYFSMEVGFDPAIPTYAGGLGVLAGDTLRAAADLELPMVGVTPLHRQGYFRQVLDAAGRQSEAPATWDPAGRLEEVSERVSVRIEGRDVWVRAWRHLLSGRSGFRVPLYLLDTDLPENDPRDRALTDDLYGGDDRHRLAQEAVLGLGGAALLEALGLNSLTVYHMNEGHAALLALALLEREGGGLDKETFERVRRHCVFTTHTPVPAGHDQFPRKMVEAVLGQERAKLLLSSGCCLDQELNMTYLALYFSRYVNGVAMRHGEVSRGLYPDYPIASITNGVHAATWTAPPFRELFDRFVPDWRLQNDNLRYAVSMPLEEIRAAHRACKLRLLEEVERRAGVRLDPNAMTLGFARRATPYKRADLLLSDLDRLRKIARREPLQIIYAGKAHPHDEAGKELIREIHRRAEELRGLLPVVYLADYDMALAHELCAGVDLWVNTPRKPLEASGTSGMKAALNGVPSLSVLDGWWVEGHVEGVTGWSIGETSEPETDIAREREQLYRKLDEIVDLFHGSPDAYARVMRQAIALNGSFFNAQRMLEQYSQEAYRFRARAV